MRDESVPKQQYTDEFKIEFIWLSDSVGGDEATKTRNSFGDVEQLVAQAQASRHAPAPETRTAHRFDR